MRFKSLAGVAVIFTMPARVTEQTVFAIASLTKAFTAAAAGILVDRGSVASPNQIFSLSVIAPGSYRGTA